MVEMCRVEGGGGKAGGEESDVSPRLGLELWRENLRGEGQPWRNNGVLHFE